MKKFLVRYINKQTLKKNSLKKKQKKKLLCDLEFFSLTNEFVTNFLLILKNLVISTLLEIILYKKLLGNKASKKKQIKRYNSHNYKLKSVFKSF